MSEQGGRARIAVGIERVAEARQMLLTAPEPFGNRLLRVA